MELKLYHDKEDLDEIDQCFRDCIKMWKWIVRHLKKKGSDGWTVDAEELKREYTKKFNIRKLSRRNFYCFFCRRGTLASGTNDGNVKCDYCPAKIMDRRFDCCSDTYNYEHEPVKFYNKIVSLYKKFKKQRRKEKI